MPTPDDRLRFVALGDSYTIGTSVHEHQRWPNQLVGRVPRLDLVANLAVNGYTSADVIDHQLPALPELNPGFVSLLVGVNDVVRGIRPDGYRPRIELILDALLDRLAANRILLVTTPDYTVTPRGADYGDPPRQRAGIVRNNAILAEAAQTRSLPLVDIFDVSSQAATDRSLVAEDGLHPSGVQYSRWLDRIAPVVEGMVAR